MKTEFDNAVVSVINRYHEIDRLPSQDRDFTYTYTYESNQITLTINKRVQKLFEKINTKLWKGCTYILTDAECDPPPSYTYAHLKIENCTIDELSRLESRLEFAEVITAITIEHFHYSEPLTFEFPQYFFKHLNIEEPPVKVAKGFTFNHPLPESLFIGCKYPIPNFDHLTEIPKSQFEIEARTCNRLFHLSKRVVRTEAFEAAVTSVLDKYLEFDKSEVRDRRLIHSESYGPNTIKLTVDKKMQRLFEESEVPLWKSCQYIVETAGKTMIYANIKLKHCTLSQLKYLEEQLMERDIKAGLYLPRLVLAFPNPVNYENKVEVKRDNKRYKAGNIRGTSFHQYTARKFSSFGTIKADSISSIGGIPEEELKRLAPLHDRVQPILSGFTPIEE